MISWVKENDTDDLIYTSVFPKLYEMLLVEADIYADHKIGIPYDEDNELTNYIAARYPPYADVSAKLHTYADRFPRAACDFDRIIIADPPEKVWSKVILDSFAKLSLRGGRLTAVIPPDWEDNKLFRHIYEWKLGFYDLTDTGIEGYHILSTKA